MSKAIPSTVRPIRRLLVANRGEIACRIFCTARDLGIGTVAVFAEPDRLARHVRLADVSVPLVGSTVPGTYLDIDQVVAAARRAGADAVHPGYGFLAENADLARAVLAAGLVWVGPDPDAVEAMGSKLRSKELAAAAGVPLAPAQPLVGDDPSAWAVAVEAVGLPVLVKASSGGGGRGMRVVRQIEDLPEAVRAARREAQSAFGDPTVFAERYLCGFRHVEVQVFGDRHGTVLHLGERECSIQRRHQKVVEEAPSAGIDEATRQTLLDSAVALARSVGYVGAGTVEYLVSPDPQEEQQAYFLEMNTRLQVEHPVTEAVTGLDLVALQIRVAEGRPLPFTQEQVSVTGHAVEVRVCAEDPAADYLPSTGVLSRWVEVPGVRWDSGVEQGDLVAPHYDPLLAKAIAHGSDRAEAVARLAGALRASVVHGVRTNVGLLAAVLEDPDFAAATTATDFLDRHPAVVAAEAPEDVRLAHTWAARLHAQARRRAAAPVLAFAPPAWRNVPSPPRDHAQMHPGVNGDPSRDPASARDHAEMRPAEVGRGVVVHAVRGDLVDLEVDGLRRTYVVTADPDGPDETQPRVVWVTGGGWTSRLVEPARFPAPDEGSGLGGPTAPVPGTVTAVLVQVGAVVATGDPLVVLEAMKMEHRILAPTDGVVESLLVAPGDSVEAHQVLVTVTGGAVPPEEAP